MRSLGEDVEVRVRESVAPDALEEPPEWRSIGHIGGLGLAGTTCKHSTDTATDVGDYGARIAWFRKDLGLAIVVNDTPLHGGLVDRHVVEIVADDREDAGGAAEGSASGITILDDQQASFAV